MARKKTETEAVDGEVVDFERDVPNETKSERFVRLSKSRMPKVLKALSQIENLATANYESTPEQQKKIVDTLRMAVGRIQTAFDKPKKSADELGFDFD